MALTKPILYSQSAFDATNLHQFTFNVIGGDQVVRNQLIITNQETNQIVYNQTQITYSFTHNLPADTLTNGTYYSAYIITYNSRNDVSPQSLPIQFHCYSTPSFSFTNIPLTGIVNNSTYSFQLIYNQREAEPLKSYIMHLYDAQRTEITNSGVKYAGDSAIPTILNYTFSGLSNNTNYYIRATGVTSEGTQIDTGYISFAVNYIKPNVFSIVELTNNCNGGYVLVKSNLSAINGTSSPVNPVYINNKEVDTTREGSFVEWKKGYEIVGDFSASLWGRNFNVDSTIIRLKNKDNDELTITLRKNIENLYYAELKVKNNLTGLTYYIYSKNIDVIDSSDNLQIWFRKIDNLYEINLYNLSSPNVSVLEQGILG